MREVMLSVVLLGVLVTIHELGHFLAGRSVGVFIHEFAVGFGPLIFSTQKDETKYSLRLIPIGGFTRFAGGERGAGAEDEDAHVPPHRRMDKQPPGKRAWIVSAGPLANLLLAAVIFFVVFAFVGVMQPTTVIAEVLPGYPAHQAGVQIGDQLLSIDGKEIKTWDNLVGTVEKKAGVPIQVTLRRGPETRTVTVVPVDSEGVGLIGVRPEAVKTKLNPLAGFLQGFRETVTVSIIWLQGIVGMLLRRVPADVTGPLGITMVLGEAARMGAAELLYLAGALSANLGLINLLPIPALDGSRLVFCAWEAVRKKPIDPEKEGVVHLVGFFILISLFVLVTYKDVLRLVRGGL